MINYKDMYNKMDNTLTHEAVKKIIEEYLTTGCINNYIKWYYASKLEDSLYFEKLPKEKQDIMLKNHFTYRDKLYSLIFNYWKKNVTSFLTDDQIKCMINKDYSKLRDYLKKIPYIDSYNEFDKIIRENELCSKYSKTFFLNNGWEHVFSEGLIYPIQPKINVEHRLYLNPYETDCYELAYLFTEKCLSRNIPFYFKMDNGVSDDKIVIYSDTEHLKVYISILDEIKKIHPDIVSRALKPPALCGLVDSWIGYGSEPKQKKESFNSVREKLFETVLDGAIGNQKAKYRGKKIDVNDAFVKHVRQNVLQICGNLGIDSNTFCFDIDARNKLFNYEDGYGSMGNNGKSNQSFTNGQK